MFSSFLNRNLGVCLLLAKSWGNNVKQILPFSDRDGYKSADPPGFSILSE